MQVAPYKFACRCFILEYAILMVVELLHRPPRLYCGPRIVNVFPLDPPEELHELLVAMRNPLRTTALSEHFWVLLHMYMPLNVCNILSCVNAVIEVSAGTFALDQVKLGFNIFWLFLDLSSCKQSKALIIYSLSHMISKVRRRVILSRCNTLESLRSVNFRKTNSYF